MWIHPAISNKDSLFDKSGVYSNTLSCLMQVHMCNKLASRHVRVGLADPNKLARCDICENLPGMLFDS